MGRRVRLEAHLAVEELERRYRAAKEPHERTWWQILWLLTKGQTVAAVSESTGYSRYWTLAARAALQRRGPRGDAQSPVHPFAPGTAAALARAAGRAGRGGAWAGARGRPLAGAHGGRLDEPTARPADQRLSRLGVPGALGRQATQAPAAACAGRPRRASGLQKKGRPLVQAVATAHPEASVELWATDEHRVGLKPILHKVWCFDGQRPIAPVQHRDAWRYVVGFVQPSSGRALFHLATSVSIPLFAAALAAFARRVGAGPQQQIVRLLDRAGWHARPRLRVPEQVHLLFLPPYSPERQPAEHLWPLTNTALANRHFVTIDELEDAQSQRCVALQAHPERIRSATLPPWWPRRIKKRQGPRRN